MPEPVAPAKPISPPSAAQPASTQPVSPPQAAIAPRAADLVKRVAEAPKEQPAAANPAEQAISITLDEIKDPVAKTIIENKIKDLERGWNKKYMGLAEEKKQVEALRQELESKINQPWTPERVLEISKDSNFISSAQTAVELQRRNAAPQTWEGSSQAWSALTDQEKEAFRQMEVRQRTSESQVATLLNQQRALIDQQEHERVKTRFADYDPQVVDRRMRELADGKVPTETIKELIWKAENFDRYVENSYKFGLQDRQGNLTEKINGATSPNGASTTIADTSSKPTLQEGERPATFFRRLAEWNLRQRK